MSEKRRSLTTTEGMGRAPNRAMLRAVGFLDDDFDRPMIGVAILHSATSRRATPTSTGSPARPSRASAPAAASPQIFGAPTASDGIMMGHQGMRYQPRVARGHRRLHRGRRRRHEPRRRPRLRRLRQEHARLPHGHGPAQRPQHLRLRRQHPARHRRRRRRHRHRLHLRGGRPVPGRQARREGRPQGRVRGLPRRRLVRRHVHRQHHVQRHRGDGHVAALRRQLSRPCRPPRSARRSWPARRWSS